MRCQAVGPKDRRRLLGNSWHLGVARFMLALVLMQGATSQVGRAEKDLEAYMSEARSRELPVAGHLHHQDRAAVQPSSNMWEQWHNSLEMRGPLLMPPRLEPAIEGTMAALMRE